jgi:phosphate transport system substrate-binding protein
VVVALAVVVVATAACTKKVDDPTASGDAKGKVTISGSSTVEPITALVAEEFMAANSGASVSVDGPGTGDGFKLFCAGDTDVSNASRPIKAEEAEACEAAGVEFIELEVGIDGLSVVVPDSSEVECLSFADLYALIGPESEGFSNWTDAQALAAELGSDTTFPDSNLVITAPGTESGTYDSFVELVIEPTAKARAEAGKVAEDLTGSARADYSASPDDNAIIEGVTADPGGLGWVGFAFGSVADGVNLVPVAAEPGGKCVEPTVESIQDGSYPIARRLYVYVNSRAAADNQAVAAFIDFYLQGLDDYVSAVDYIPLADPSATLATWADRKVGSNVEVHR